MMSYSLGFALAMLLMMFSLGVSYQIAKETGWFGKPATLVFKGLTTFVAAVLALYAYSISGAEYALVLAVGIALCALADVLLELHFLSGTACFAAGHILYITAFIKRSPPQTANILVFLVLAGISYLVMQRARKNMGNQVLPYFVYALIISCMVAMSIHQPMLATVGALMFAASDAIIARRLIKPQASDWDRACILLYYMAQYLLAASLLL